MNLTKKNVTLKTMAMNLQEWKNNNKKVKKHLRFKIN